MHWRIKGIVQKLLGLHPRGAALHHRLQRRFGGLHDFRRELSIKVDDWTIMVGHLRATGVPIEGTRFFEIGTGWYPTLPIACYLCGAARVTTYDLSPHLQPQLVSDCIVQLADFLDALADASGAPRNEVNNRHARLAAAWNARSDLEMASDGVIRYAAPADATRTDLEDGEIDVLFSNSVLEHVPPDVITEMHRESMRILAPGGLMFHSVNCGDHYAYVDSSISQLNYLQYSDRVWAFWNNAFLYQNRLRAHEFVDAAAAAGFEVVLDTSTPRPQRLKELEDVPVHPRFRHLPAEKLCITSVDFIGRSPRHQPQPA